MFTVVVLVDKVVGHLCDSHACDVEDDRDGHVGVFGGLEQVGKYFFPVKPIGAGLHFARVRGSAMAHKYVDLWFLHLFYFTLFELYSYIVYEFERVRESLREFERV